jgi:hypothetical protein
MNGKRTDFDDNHDGERFDPELAALFSEANEAPLEGDAFVHRVLREVEQARHRRLPARVGSIVATLTAGAFAAPYVGERTFDAVDWLARNMSTSAFAPALPAVCALAALFTWRIARRGFR